GSGTLPGFLSQLDQPLPPPPERGEPRPAPKLTKAPTIKKQVEPVYPAEALDGGIGGDVTLTIDIAADGRVTAVAVARSAGHGFDEAAAAAAREMEFFPAEVDGRASPIRITYTIHFQPQMAHASDGGVPEDAAPTDAASPDAAAADGGPAQPPVATRIVVRGEIRERGTREPLAGADVAIIRRGAASGGGDLPAEVVGTTDDDGRFEVRAPEGALRVVVSDTLHDSCVRDFAAAELAGPNPVAWTCYARKRAGGLNETRVRARPEHPEETRQTLSKAELTTVPGTIGDPLRVLQNMPGVARAPFGLGLLIVRGANPGDTGVFIGGEPIPVLYHFLAGPSVFTANLIDKIDFYPGGFGVRYGRFIGGVVDVNVKGDVGKTLHGAVDINLRDSSAFVEGPLPGGVRTSFAFRRSYIDAILPLILPYIVPSRAGSTFFTVAPVYWDYQARADKDLPGGGRVGLLAYGSSDSLEIISSDPTVQLESNTHIGFHHVMGEWVSSLGDWNTRLSATYGYGDQSLSTGAFGGYQRYHRLWGREDISRRFNSAIAVAAGLDFVLSYDWAHYTDLPFPRDGRTIGNTMPPQSVDVVRSLYDAAPAAYAEAQWNITPALRIVPGLRLDYYHVVETDKFSYDPRLALRWDLTPRWAVKAAVGLYHQLPNPQFLDRVYGNPNLLLSWADQYQVGVEHKFTDADEVTATAFFVRRHDLPVATIDHFSSVGRSRSYGLELWLRHNVTEHFYGWIAYTLSRSEVAGTLAEGVPMGMNNGMARNGGDLSWRPGPFDQTHNLIVVGSYRFRDWETGASYRLVTGTPRTPVVGSFFDSDFGTYTRETGAPGSARNATYSQLDVRVERRFTFDRWVLGIYLDIINVLNSENAEGVLYDYRSRQSAPLRGVPILPILGLRGRF
ncbi:MAG TPA: TonB-dependent receptor, partial [Polyangia bacterium]|nr:TonB-dependent receptor [Polyangia bacterium]